MEPHITQQTKNMRLLISLEENLAMILHSLVFWIRVGACYRWDNAFSAADGKRIALFHPKESGSEFYEYKGFYSDYKFTYIGVGFQGRLSDGRVYNDFGLKKAILNN